MAWLGEVQWLSLLSLFVAALAVVAAYLVQYGLSALRRSGEKPPPSPPSELVPEDEDSLFAWLLSLSSWRREWQKAWITALNWEAKLKEDSRLFTFEEDEASQTLELVVQRVVNVVKSAEEKVVSCNIAGNAFQFIVNVTHPSLTPAECESYSVKLSPFHLQLELSMKAKEEDIQVKWSFIHTSETNTEIKPIIVQQVQKDGNSTASEKLKGVLQNLINSASPSVILSTKTTDVEAIQKVQNTGTLPQGTSPPKPPRAHELKLLMKNVKASLTSQSTADNINPVCVIQLNDPLQKFCSSVANNPTDLSWNEEFIFELNAKSKDLQLKIFENGEIDSDFSALATVPLDLFRKQPSGQRSFALNSNLSRHSPTVGFVSAEFSYIEPSESRHLKFPTTFPIAKVEKDRTVMPCGTVVTTVTAVKTKPLIEGRSSALHSDSPVKSPAKMKVIEKDLSIQAIHCRKTSVSKALSLSDTELLVLNGTDPVAEVAIRQLSESAKQKLKSPRKKSTIIISGVSETNLSQDCEAALMMDYAAAMDGSYIPNDTTAMEESVAWSSPDEELSLSASQTLPSHEDTQENSHDAWTLDDSSQQWHSNALLDHDCDKVSESSISISESGTVKKSKGGILKKGARLFFLRRHHQKDPGMSQSHNDLIYLQQPVSDGAPKKGGTLTRLLNRKILSKSKSKNKLNGTSVEPYA
ncbi:C2 domain-containing protein 2 [Eublepharis macularius]|uniref:C2 domain-containing protein 2 n=1 Tax=Eublepharis macularius TaxID=481883 RepID=A0AA97J0V6_EUBMA|nr:C2 domain-containing protein 2 [Eublepharis macularius]